MSRFQQLINEIDLNLIEQPAYKHNLERLIAQIDLIQFQFGEKPQLEVLRHSVLKVYKQIIVSEKYGQ